MEEFNQTNQVKQKVTEIKTVTDPLCIRWKKENLTISSKRQNQFSQEEIISQAFKFDSQGNISEAEKYYQYFINQGFLDHRVFCNYGILMISLGRLKEAELYLRKAIELKPNYVIAYSNLGNILKILGKLKEAEILQRKAIEFKPDFATAHCNLGSILSDLGNLKEAEISTRKAIRLKPNYAMAHSNLGSILSDLDKLKEAESSHRKAIKLQPNLAMAHSNLGHILSLFGKSEEAEISHRKAIELQPNFAEAHYNLANILLKQIKFKEGWEHYEWRWKVQNRKLRIGDKLVTSKPDWSPNKSGRVLLWPEQGIGDQLLFLSVLPDVIDKVSKLILQVDERLFPLLKRSIDNKKIEFVSKDDHINEIEYDFQLPFGSLPKYARPTLKSFETSKHLKLKVNKEKSNHFRENLLSKQYKKIVGIAWKSTSTINRNRSLSLEEFILGIYSPEICFVCLQYGEVKEEILDVKKRHGIHIHEVEEVDKFNNIDDLAALVNACDEVVSIENTTLFIAGGIGIKSYILLTKSCAWMNGTKELKSNWYPSLNLVRKNQNKTWDQALNQIQKKLMSKN